MGNTTASHAAISRHASRDVSDRNAPPASLSSFRVLVVPGLHGSGAEHWQSRWQRLYPAFERVEQEHWDDPQLAVWSARLQAQLQTRSSTHPQVDTRPVLIVAHSFGCLTTVHRAAAGAGQIAGALLVAPADPVKFQVADLVHTALPFPSLVIASSNDPWMTAERAQYWATQWHSELVPAGALGHINAESGLGDWPAGQLLLLTLAQKASAARKASVLTN